METNFDFRTVWTNPVHFLSFGFGSGLAPKMPGTVGTVAAIPLYLLIMGFSWPVYAVITLILIGLGIWWCDITEKATGIPDYPGIVWDEIVGYLATMFLAPTGWQWIVLGFILFRVFDIWKPGPIGWVNKHVKGGLGVVVDDLAAAVPAWIILQLIVWLF